MAQFDTTTMTSVPVSTSDSLDDFEGVESSPYDPSLVSESNFYKSQEVENKGSDFS